ncbi:type II toxin-antitoxin system YafQ family toxin [Salmonella enterica]|nr:type II toxin-antitoxin system YafQ family toxin [Salmonella enterica]
MTPVKHTVGAKRLLCKGYEQNTLLIEDKLPLPAIYKDHPLQGDYKGYRDAHIEPDWLLIYKISDTELRFERTGTHSDLFK